MASSTLQKLQKETGLNVIQSLPSSYFKLETILYIDHEAKEIHI